MVVFECKRMFTITDVQNLFNQAGKNNKPVLKSGFE